MSYRQEFIKYVKEVEGSKKRKGLHYPYPSAEGGTPTIGYGHKMTEAEAKTITTLNEAQAEALLVRDLNAAKIRAAAVIGDSWATFTEIQKEMSIDFTFNLGKAGFAKFKKFIAALKANNWKGISQSYRRYYRTPSGEVKELKHRNQKFFDFFIKPNLE